MNQFNEASFHGLPIDLLYLNRNLKRTFIAVSIDAKKIEAVSDSLAKADFTQQSAIISQAKSTNLAINPFSDAASDVLRTRDRYNVGLVNIRSRHQGG